MGKEDSMIRADKGITVNPWLILFFSRRKWDQRLTFPLIMKERVNTRGSRPPTEEKERRPGGRSSIMSSRTFDLKIASLQEKEGTDPRRRAVNGLTRELKPVRSISSKRRTARGQTSS